MSPETDDRSAVASAKIASAKEPRRYSQQNPTTPKICFALVLAGSLLVLNVQLPDDFWLGLLRSIHIQPDLFGFLLLTSAYLIAVLLMAPLSPFALAAGLLFGFWWGAVLALFALNLGAALAFLIARYLLREPFARHLSGGRRRAAIARAMRGDTVTTIAILRLNPLVPFNLHNYLCGAMAVNFVRYLAGTLLGAAPLTLALVYLGHAGRRMVAATGLEIGEWTLLLFVVGVAMAGPMTLALIGRTVKRVKEYRDHDQVPTVGKNE